MLYFDNHHHIYNTNLGVLECQMLSFYEKLVKCIFRLVLKLINYLYFSKKYNGPYTIYIEK